MDKIKQFTITRIKMQGFKVFKETKEIHLGTTSYIYGANGQGKSSVADAVSYAFCGVPFWGEKSADRLMCKGENQMCVEVDFVNEYGELFKLVRRKNGNTTSITLNDRQMTQTNLVNIFAEKDIFLSLINPLYFIEKISTDGRQFLQRLLPPISNDEVLARLSEQNRDIIESGDVIDTEYYLKTKRAKLKETDEQEMYLSGQLALMEEQLRSNSVTRNKLETAVSVKKAKISKIAAKQFEGIDIENLKQQYETLKQSLPDKEMLEAEKQRMQIQSRQYSSKYLNEIIQVQTEFKNVHNEYNRLYQKAAAIRPGVPCPTCTHSLTETEFNSVKTDIVKELNELKSKGINLKSQLDDLTRLDAQSKEQFLQFQKDDLFKTEERIKALKTTTNSDIEKLHDTITFGNFSEEQVNALEAMKAELFADETDLKALKSEEELKKSINSVKLQIKDNETVREFTKHQISAANEYSVKKAEMMIAPLKMNKAAIKLFEIVKSTGEMKSTFKFTYDGKDYAWLSNSERIKAGLEVANLLKRLTKLAYPTFIDNAESINTGFSRPYGQTIFAFVKNCPLTVQNPSSQVVKEAA